MFGSWSPALVVGEVCSLVRSLVFWTAPAYAVGGTMQPEERITALEQRLILVENDLQHATHTIMDQRTSLDRLEHEAG